MTMLLRKPMRCESLASNGGVEAQFQVMLKEDKMTGNIKMPAIFVGHGSPMNAIEDNEYTRGWEAVAGQIARPKAILAISAHWTTNGTKVIDEPRPRMIYDMYGFPDELYRVSYPVNGSPEVAGLVMDILGREYVRIDNSWGIDHGTWSVLCRIYPKADIPVLQLSLDMSGSAQAHFEIGRKLGRLRDEGVLIMGSGNVVHNLAAVDWRMKGGHAWATEFDGYIRETVKGRIYEGVIDYRRAGKSSELAFFTAEHFYPLLYVLGASNEDDVLTVFNDSCTLGSISMTSYLFK